MRGGRRGCGRLDDVVEWCSDEPGRAHRTAVESGGASLSCGALDVDSTRLARHLRRRRLGAGDRVAVLLDRADVALTAQLAIAKIGATWVPLDHDLPGVALTSVLSACGVGRSPHAAGLSPDGTRLAVVNFDGGDVSIIDTSTDAVIATVPVGAGPQHISWAPDGRHFYIADVRSGTVSVVDGATYRRTASVPVGSSPASVAVHPDGSRALATLLDESQLAILATGG